MPELPHTPNAWWGLTLSLALAACAQEPIGAHRQDVRVPGDWNPPASTREIAATQFVDVVDPPTVLPLGSCTSTDPWVGTCTHPACLRAHPGTTELDVYIRTRWPYVRAGGTYSCRRNSNPSSTEYLSVHSIGRAIDLMIPTIEGDADNTAGDAVANWLIENAEYIGIQRVIWDGMFWNGERGFSEISDVRTSSGAYRTDHHVNHIHTELSVDGAAKRTRFFTEGAPPMTCPVVCYGTAAVREDCTFVDCAATGEVCLPSPPRCGPPTPLEPPEATRLADAMLPAVTPVAGLSRFRFVPAERLFDTRTPEGSARLVRSDGATSGPLGPMRSGSFRDWTSLPAGTSGAWLNVTAVPRTEAGFVQAYAEGSLPETSTAQFAPGSVRANAAATTLGPGGAVTFAANAEVDLVVDWTGVFAPSGLGLRAASPTRVLDTRAAGVTLTPGVPFPVDVRAPADAEGVVASMVVLGGEASGFVSVTPCGAPVPPTSNINFRAGAATANTVISALGAGNVCVVSTQAIGLIVDVNGYLVPAGELSYQALSPVRVLDTRAPAGLYTGRVGERQILDIPLSRASGMPADVRATVVNLTVTDASARGFLTVFPCGEAVPGTSSLNFEPDVATSALAFGATGGGSLCVFASGRAHVLVDVLGVWVPTPAAPPPTVVPGVDPNAPDDPRLPDGGIAGDAGTDDAGRPAVPRPLTASGCAVAPTPATRGNWPAWSALGLALCALVTRRRARVRPHT
jgi:hypothetical protein